MKRVLFVVLVLVVIVGGTALFLPMSIAADFVARQERQFQFAHATGSVWDGKLTHVRFGQQTIGDVKVKAEPLKLFGGEAAGTLAVVRKAYSGSARVVYGLKSGGLKVSNMKLTGSMAAAPGLPEIVKASGGKFSLEISDLVMGQSACETAKGEIWTDALTRVDLQGKWIGPELRGPVTCEDGRLVADVTGVAETGEQVAARIDIGSGLEMDLSARVEGATPAAVKALSKVGFVADGSTMVLRRRLGRS